MFSKWFTPTTLRQAIAPMSLASSVIGIGVIEYPPGQRRPLLSLIYSVTFVLLFAAMVYLSTGLILSFQEEDTTEMVYVLYIAIIYGNMVIGLSAMILGWSRSKKLVECFDRCVAVDESLMDIGIPTNYQNIFIVQLYLLVGINMIIVIMAVMDSTWMLKHVEHLGYRIALSGLYHHPILVMFLVDSNFFDTVWSMGKRFESLNAFLHGLSGPDVRSEREHITMFKKSTKIFAIAEPMSDGAYNSEVKLRLVQSSRKIHRELCTIARRVNTAYGLQILVSMGVSMALITGLLYNVYVSIKDVKRPADLQVISLMFWCALFSLKIMMVSHACSYASDQAQRTGQIIHELTQPSADEQLQDEIREFSLQLIQTPLIFTACGFFKVDHTFVQGVIGSITTYLIIMIQMSNVPLPE